MASKQVADANFGAAVLFLAGEHDGASVYSWPAGPAPLGRTRTRSSTKRPSLALLPTDESSPCLSPVRIHKIKFPVTRSPRRRARGTAGSRAKPTGLDARPGHGGA
jgi:hypothetical protein